MGVTYLGGYVEPESDPPEMQVSHTLEINQIRLTLETSGSLMCWTPEAFIRVLNMSPALCYVKTYDAVAQLSLGDGIFSDLAIECELSLKSEERYGRISQLIAKESRLHTILYLASSYEVAATLRRCLEDTKQKVLLAQVDKFKKDVLETQVDLAGTYRQISLRDVLTRRAAQKKAAALR